MFDRWRSWLSLVSHQKNPPRHEPVELGAETVDVVTLAKAEDYIDTHYDVAAIEYFMKLFTQLPDHLSRVDEDMHLSSRTVRSTTHLFFRGARSLTTPANGLLLVPIVRARK